MRAQLQLSPLKSFPPIPGIRVQRKRAADGPPGSHFGATASRLPTIVHNAVRAPGQPLDPVARAFFEPRFGHDFGNVRIHADDKAAASARALNASAYTVGREIVFGEGRYAPLSLEGRRLLAHELTHVVQQRSSDVALPVRLAAADTASERSAAAVESRAFESPTGFWTDHGSGEVVAGQTVQRSLIGGILGGLAGAAGGALIGGLLGGPIGAVVGGVAGLIGGALLADKATTRSRKLTSTEITYATEIFKDSIDYSEITITRDSLISTGAPKTIGDTIHLRSDWGHFKDDTLDLTQEGMETLIHEMGHVWQYQNGGLAYIPESLWAQLKGAIKGGSRDAAYNWREAHKAGTPWEKWNPEQQAAAIEDYNRLLRRSKNGTATIVELSELATLLPYMQKVWNREGAPTFKRPDLRAVPF